MNCLFCKIIAGEIPCYKVYEDSDFIAFLDIYPVNPGHVLVIPKVHCDNIFELSDDIASKYFVVVKKMASIIKESVNADGINIGMNNLSAAGQIIFHSHVHVIPRFNDDGLKHWSSKEISSENMEEIADKIKIIINKNA